MSRLPKSIVIMNPNRLSRVYGLEQLQEIKVLTDLVSSPLSAEEVQADPSILNEVEVIFGGWGMPGLTAEFLDQAPRLKAIFYSAGTVKSFITPEVYKRNIVITNAHHANAVPVAEYCLATILFSLKLGWRHERSLYSDQVWRREDEKIIGAYDATVGLISLGAIGYKTLELLRPFKLKVLVYSTSLSGEDASELGVQLAGIEKIFRESDVVSLHTPALPSTYRMIEGRHFEMMRPNATFINTARGAVVHQEEMIEALRVRTDLTAIIDVTEPEPPEPGDPIFSLPNIVVTPHIAGSLGQECRRLGQTAIDECRRFLSGEKLKYPVLESDLARMA